MEETQRYAVGYRANGYKVFDQLKQLDIEPQNTYKDYGIARSIARSLNDQDDEEMRQRDKRNLAASEDYHKDQSNPSYGLF